MVFFRQNPSIFEEERKRPLGNAEVRTNLFEKIPNPFGIFLLSVFFGLVGFFKKCNGEFEPIIALSAWAVSNFSFSNCAIEAFAQAEDKETFLISSLI